MRFVQNALLCLMPIPEQKKKCSQTAKFPKIRPVPPTPGPLHFEQALLQFLTCLLYTSDAADDTPCVDLGGRRIIKKRS